MGYKASQCNKTLTSSKVFTVTPSLERWPTKAKDKDAPSFHEVRLTLLNTSPVFQCLGNLFL